ncbi:MAG TPA: hypothetical protein VGL97_12770 [Bryobacteraceae bacterium]|jgi:hypothetical protein
MSTITLSQQDIQRNMRCVARAVAQQELEGLKVPEATVIDLQRVARGEIDTDEVIRNVQRRVGNDRRLRMRPLR